MKILRQRGLKRHMPAGEKKQQVKTYDEDVNVVDVFEDEHGNLFIVTEEDINEDGDSDYEYNINVTFVMAGEELDYNCKHMMGSFLRMDGNRVYVYTDC